MKTVTYMLKSGETLTVHSDVAGADRFVDGFVEWCRLSAEAKVAENYGNVVFTTNDGNRTAIRMAEVAAIVVT